MIKEKEVIVKISPKTYKMYYEKYGPYNNNDLICISVSDLSKNSRLKVTAICKICFMEKEVFFQNYNIQISRGGYYSCKKCSTGKIKSSCMEKYGVTHLMKSPDFRESVKKKLIEKYGIDNVSKSEEVKNKKKETMLKNYGVESTFNSKILMEKSKNTWMEKYGVDNPSKSNEIKQKKEVTCLKNYGVNNPTQSSDIFEKSQKSGKKIKLHEIGLMYRGTYEKHFLDYCLEKKLEVSKGPTIKYNFNGKVKYYHSDFYIKKLDLICEIKSSYYYKRFKEMNECKKIYSEKEHNFIFIINKDYSDIEKLINGI